MANLKKNVIYSSILTTANYVFPLLTYPYVSRILGVDKIGICNFVDSIINYFMLISMMGISIIGIREIANNKNDQTKLDNTFSSLFFINTISTVIMLIILIITINIVPQLYEHKDLMYIGALKLLFNYLLVEWLYKGLENFKFITTRTIITKCLYVIAIFIFIHNANDYKAYYIILSLMIIVNAIINISYSHKYIHFKTSGINIKSFIKPNFILGSYMILTSMYTSFNVAYLGFTSGETEVGYYSTATRLYSIILSLFTAFTGVMLPRMSSLVAENKMNEFKSLFNKSIDLLLGISIPLIIFSETFTHSIILLISGKGYEGAIIPMQIVMPLIFIIGYEQILVIQTLIPLKNDKAIFINSIIGACIGIFLNILLVPPYKSIGSAFVWLLSELSVLITSQYFVYKKTKIKFPYVYLIKNIIYNIPLAVLMYCISMIDQNAIIVLLIALVTMLIYSIVLQYYIIKNKNFINIINTFTSRFLKLKKQNSQI